MMMDVVVAAMGLILALGGVVASFRTRSLPIAIALSRLDIEPGEPGSEVGSPNTSRPFRIDEKVGMMLADWLAVQGPRLDRVRRDLRAVGRPMSSLCSEVVVASGVGLLLIPVMWTLVTLAGVSIPIVVPVWSAIACGACGAALPFLALERAVQEARRTARLVVGLYLDMVGLCLAGGMGIEGALLAAASIGDADVSRRIERSLVRARDSGASPWAALAQLGSELSIDELDELAAAVSLAGTEGARIRATLAAKASSIRRHQLAEAEAKANALTERLFLPGVFLLVGFLVFIGYPALVRITVGL
jgi:tight adherence protein C